ncbi:hypothetical protein VN12_23435 [Pirellula sp. SH-Sr6A]|uniref:hypothetical protein n=1 Tax=Pirellula sp. SH-Sr6A TaxID=1632865 RepID=UPI00078D2CEF|nr:hypothetical protein [Pirellula sp. SH-Sr6A]AMV35099.1 hypothetical protein VN12_23435 [Pirellula sp. SH-Sr6A]
MAAKNAATKRTTGIGQLSLVEHALCPLDPKVSLTENLVFDSEYFYYPNSDTKRSARARVFCPLGLSAADELYLWGLLALTLLQPNPEPELFATPHWCLRQLGVINQTNKRGGRQYKQFAEAIRRLSAVTYMNDGFYDPIREEHRRVSFRFFSYSLPVNLESGRSWRIAWDPIFFEMIQSAAGHFRFDLAIYRELDAASRRLFLFVSKVLPRRSHLNALRLEHVAVNILGFSSSVATRDMKVKVSKCLQNLIDLHVLSEAEVFKTSPGRYYVRLSRGPYFAQKSQRAYIAAAEDSPLFETLQIIGFEEAAAARLIAKFPPRLLAEWADITQAAIERFGVSYFHKSPMAYLVDSVTKAAQGTRTCPDWWQDLKRAERQELEMSVESQRVFTQIRAELFGDVSEPTAPAKRREGPIASVSQILRNIAS